MAAPPLPATAWREQAPLAAAVAQQPAATECKTWGAQLPSPTTAAAMLSTELRMQQERHPPQPQAMAKHECEARHAQMPLPATATAALAEPCVPMQQEHQQQGDSPRRRLLNVRAQ
jgi:hypothetical protein